MKRVCTLRKVLSFSFKGPLRKVIFYRSYIVAFYRHSVLIVLISWLLSPLSSYRLWNISCREIFHVANISIFFETCKFLSIFFQKKANFLMFFIK